MSFWGTPSVAVCHPQKTRALPDWGPAPWHGGVGGEEEASWTAGISSFGGGSVLTARRGYAGVLALPQAAGRGRGWDRGSFAPGLQRRAGAGLGLGCRAGLQTLCGGAGVGLGIVGTPHPRGGPPRRTIKAAADGARRQESRSEPAPRPLAAACSLSRSVTPGRGECRGWPPGGGV